MAEFEAKATVSLYQPFVVGESVDLGKHGECRPPPRIS